MSVLVSISRAAKRSVILGLMLYYDVAEMKKRKEDVEYRRRNGFDIDNRTIVKADQLLEDLFG